MTTTAMRGVWCACGLAILLSACAGCDPLTRNRFDMIVVGTSDEIDVERTIGEPTHRQPQQWHYERAERHLNVLIGFDQEGIVARKQWVDSEAGEWIDSREPPETSTRESTEIRTIR